MDYHAIHGYDVSSFDIDATHRLPTVTAAQASVDLSDSSRCIATGLDVIDADGGVQKGEVTEIWGPPGIGKTAFGIQLAAEVLAEDRSVVWVDAFHSMCVKRLAARVASRGQDTAEATQASAQDVEKQLAKFLHYACPTLPHFLALLCRPTADSIPDDTSLLVIDSLSSLVNHAFPRASEPKGKGKGMAGTPFPLSRRLPVLEYIITALQKLAAMRNLAVVILAQCATRMQAEQGAMLIPAINANVWEQGCSTRIVLFRDWVQHDGKLAGHRFAGLVRSNGKGSRRLVGDCMTAFEIAEDGIRPISLEAEPGPAGLAGQVGSRYHTRSADFEIADSDEEYGWQEEDTGSLPPLPPQWQGTEDLLLGQDPDSDARSGVDGSLDERLEEDDNDATND